MYSDGVVAKQLARAVFVWMGTAGHLIWPSFITEKKIHCNSFAATGGLGASSVSLSRFLRGAVRERIPVAGYDRRAAVFFKEHEGLLPSHPFTTTSKAQNGTYFFRKSKINFSNAALRFRTARSLRWYFLHKTLVQERFAPVI